MGGGFGQVTQRIPEATLRFFRVALSRPARRSRSSSARAIAASRGVRKAAVECFLSLVYPWYMFLVDPWPPRTRTYPCLPPTTSLRLPCFSMTTSLTRSTMGVTVWRGYGRWREIRVGITLSGCILRTFVKKRDWPHVFVYPEGSCDEPDSCLFRKVNR